MGSKPKGISGSRGASVLGLNPWTTPFEVWQRIMEERTPGFNDEHGYEMPKDADNPSTRWGLAFEDSIIALSESVTGKTITDREREYHMAHNGVDLTCHVDGLYHAAVHEGKTSTFQAWRKKWGEPGTDKVPRHYQIQGHHNMMLSAQDTCIVSVLVFPVYPGDWEDMGWSVYHDGERYWMKHEDHGDSLTSPWNWAGPLADMGFFHQYELTADNELQDMMIEKYDEFWRKYVIPGIPPEPMNIDDLKRRMPNPCGTIVVDDRVASWAAEYKGINAELKGTGPLAKRKDQLKELILARGLEGADAVDKDTTDKWIFRDAEGNKVASWSKDKNGTFTFRV